jgi:hypothetical protein
MSEGLLSKWENLFGREEITDAKVHIFRQIATNYTKKFMSDFDFV